MKKLFKSLLPLLTTLMIAAPAFSANVNTVTGSTFAIASTTQTLVTGGYIPYVDIMNANTFYYILTFGVVNSTYTTKDEKSVYVPASTNTKIIVEQNYTNAFTVKSDTNSPDIITTPAKLRLNIRSW